MIDPIHQQLLGHLLGALDDDEHESLDARLEHDQELCRDLAAWRRQLQPLESRRPEFDPPPGLAQRTCRLVAAYASLVDDAKQVDKPRMTPLPMPPAHVPHLRWFDMAVVAFFLLAGVALVFPAILSSRFQNQVASCKNNLRQFGLALTQYGDYQRTGVTHLAKNERLTTAGIAATTLVNNVYAADNRRTVLPNAWLAAQAPPSDKQTAVADGDNLVLSHRQTPTDNQFDHWSGAWRNGATNDLRSPASPAALPLLADAPSADVPGQVALGHGGRGRNVFYADGHADFLPNPTSLDTTASAEISAPIVFVSGR